MQLVNKKLWLTGASYVNNHEMADVTFMVENRSFYGHRIILSAASATFKVIAHMQLFIYVRYIHVSIYVSVVTWYLQELLSSKPRDQQGSCIAIQDVKYDIFSVSWFSGD